MGKENGMEKRVGSIKEHSEGSNMTVALRGEIDHHNAALWRGDIDRLILEKKPKKLFLDLGHIDFMDSSGLGLIMGRYSLLKKLGCELILLNPSCAVERICRLAGLERIVRIEKKQEKREEV